MPRPKPTEFLNNYPEVSHNPVGHIECFLDQVQHRLRNIREMEETLNQERDRLQEAQISAIRAMYDFLREIKDREIILSAPT